jgi:integrase/recombinase XerD
VARQSQQPEHKACLRERDPRLHRFTGIARPEEFRTVTRAHIFAWRDELAHRGLGGSTVRHRLASLAFVVRLFSVRTRPSPQSGQKRRAAEDGKRRRQDAGARRSPGTRIAGHAPGGHAEEQARPAQPIHVAVPRTAARETVHAQGQGFRHARKGMPNLKVSGKGGKTRYLPLHPGTNALIHDHLAAVRHGTDDSGCALFRPTRNNRTGRLEAAISGDGVYKLVRAYSAQVGFAIGAHATRDGRHQCARPRNRHSVTRTSPPHGSTPSTNAAQI